MNSAIQTLLKTLGNLEIQEERIRDQILSCETSMSGWKQDLFTTLTAKAEIQLAITLLEGDKNE